MSQLDGLVDVTLDTVGGLLEVLLAHQSIESSLAALHQSVVGLGGVVEKLLRRLAQLFGAQLLAQFAGSLGQLLLQPGQRGATVIHPVAGHLGPIPKVGQDLIDGRKGEVGGADRGQKRCLQFFNGVVLSHFTGSFRFIFCDVSS